ncbi:hypothetical protein K2173_026328 [Erythroxylum novogranatense]|uniref:Uncharacterized protein n=1 Tax=Erythroxylum novogranatense TaxID=1862640 RepID=A0AAV8SMW3_9ROSI|nr:hypothetical protein K2173_026328 [Erythroxylum novogranatense]
MSGKPIVGDGLTTDLAGMTKNQLYEIMCQMKVLIDQNKQQAREILIQNPALTKALFQAQIMLGMVRPPQEIPNIQPVTSHQPQQPARQPQQPNIHTAHSLPGQAGFQEQTASSQSHPPIRKQQYGQPAISTPSMSAPTINVQSQSMPPHALQVPQQPKGHLNPQLTPISVPQSSQVPNIHPPSIHSASQAVPLHQSRMPAMSSQLQQPLQTTGIPHLPLQPPMPPQARQPSMPSFHHQYGSQMGHNVGFQHGGPQHHSQPLFHSGVKAQPSLGPSFPQGQSALPSHLPPRNMYQAGVAHIGTDFNSQAGSSMQVDRGPWMPSPPDNSTMAQPAGPPPLIPSQIGSGNQPTPIAQFTPEMEKALIQEVMKLTPEKINNLPPDQRNQVLHLQQALLRQGN